MNLAKLNTCTRQEFVAAIGWVFERSPWVAERVWAHKPFATVAALHAAMANEVDKAGAEEQIGLLRAHPDLGTRLEMSGASSSEQAGAGLDKLSQLEFTELQRLNDAYRVKFGFPFIYAVKGGTKHDILKALETRLGSARDAEIREALRQVSRIAKFRLDEEIS